MDPRPPPEPDGSADPAVPEDLDAELSRLADLPVAEHGDIFAAIHQSLATALATTGQEQVAPVQPIRPGRQRSR